MKEGVFEGSIEIVQESLNCRDHEEVRDLIPPKKKSKKKSNNLKIKYINAENNKIQQPDRPFLIFRFLHRPYIWEQEDEQYISLQQYCKKNMGTLVYKKFNNQNYNQIKSTNFYSSLFINLNYIKFSTKLLSMEDLLKHIKLQINNNQVFQEKTVRFDSNFESGNLFSAFKIDYYQYDLVLHNDTNSKGNLQWFYFCVEVQQPIELKFNIINMQKYDSLFNYGMFPVVFSERNYTKTGQQWTRGGKKIMYERNDLKLESSNRYYYTFSFSYEFKSKDKVYFAYSFPYTYTRLNELLTSISSNSIKSKLCKRRVIGHSVMNVGIQCLTFTNDIPPQIDTRKVILIFARQHPGETVGSWIAQGIIQHLLKKNKETQWLKKNYVIKLIPMVNPDGVILGNYRTNLSGCDLNRKWDSDRKDIFPEIWAVKNLIKQLHRQKKIKMIIDLHGHSKKLQSFYYGNYHDHPQVPRSFPYLASKICPDVNFSQCIFKNTHQKKNTARVYLSNFLQIPFVYTYQTSFYGGMNVFIKVIQKNNKKYAYNISDYKRLGVELLNSLFHFFCEENDIYRKAYHQLCDDLKQLLNLGVRNSQSQSNPSQFQLLDTEKDYLNDIQQKSIKKEEQQLQQIKKLAVLNIQSKQIIHRPAIAVDYKSYRSKSLQPIVKRTISKPSHLKPIQKKKSIQRINKIKLEQMKDCQCQTQQLLFEEDKNIIEQKKMKVIKSENAKILFSIEFKKSNLNSIDLSKNIKSNMIKTVAQKIGTIQRNYNYSILINEKACQTQHNFSKSLYFKQSNKKQELIGSKNQKLMLLKTIRSKLEPLRNTNTFE